MIAVVIPCYKVQKHILAVIREIGEEVEKIYIVDDHCPEHTGDFVDAHCSDPRIYVLRHKINLGVGAAMVTGYKQAIKDGVDIVVKVDGDEQMNTALLPSLVRPILVGNADYTKGNRFFDLKFLMTMPRLRLFGNSIVSLINKISSGYWNIMDPTNGFTAIHRSALEYLPLSKLDQGYFFECDMLFRLGILNAVVLDIPIEAKYGNEKSNLNIVRTALRFPSKYMNSFIKRIFYSYFLRDFNAGTIGIVFGLLFFCFGCGFGAFKWYCSFVYQIPATSGTVMLAALPILISFQLFISTINYDINSVQKKTFQSNFCLAKNNSGGEDG